jgi:hypothetical protein
MSDPINASRIACKRGGGVTAAPAAAPAAAAAAAVDAVDAEVVPPTPPFTLLPAAAAAVAVPAVTVAAVACSAVAPPDKNVGSLWGGRADGETAAVGAMPLAAAVKDKLAKRATAIAAASESRSNNKRQPKQMGRSVKQQA